MKMTRREPQCLPTTMVIIVALFVWVLSASAVAADMYTDSAHGSTSYGVNRSGAPCQNWPEGYCVTGDCAHCHDTFDESTCGVNALMLFVPNNHTSQTDNFCFQCHKGSGSVQVDGITNYTYSKNFGGGALTFTTIYDAFNPTTGDTPSSHSLSDIQTYIGGKGGFSADVNPCIACHNHHTAQQNFPVALTGLGGVKTAIRRPAHYQNLNANLWGDEDLATSGYLERMRDATDSYQAPYYGDTTDPGWEVSYEPRGENATPGDQNGSYLPNYTIFCLDCHNYSNVPSTEHGRYLYRIDYSPSGELHGQNYQGGTSGGASKAPYVDDDFNYILSCTDCHEPHGSQNEWLLRTTVNGTEVNVPGPGRYWYFCQACHTLKIHAGTWDDTRDCSPCHHHSPGPDGDRF